jgi:hypothetical protein
MPDTPPVVTASLSGTFPFVMVVAPFVIGAAAAGTVPFIPAPVEEEVGRARSEVWSAWDMGKESEEGETKALAWAAVVGRVRDSMMATISMLQRSLDRRGRRKAASERRGLKWATVEVAGTGGCGRSKNDSRNALLAWMGVAKGDCGDGLQSKDERLAKVCPLEKMSGSDGYIWRPDPLLEREYGK